MIMQDFSSECYYEIGFFAVYSWQPQLPPAEQHDPASEPHSPPEEHPVPTTAAKDERAFSAEAPHFGHRAEPRSSIRFSSSNFRPQEGQMYSYNGMLKKSHFFFEVSMPSRV
jgi:hypothetical protein